MMKEEDFIVYFSRQAIRSSFNSLPLWRRGSHFQMWRLSYKPPGLLVICELWPQTQGICNFCHV